MPRTHTTPASRPCVCCTPSACIRASARSAALDSGLGHAVTVFGVPLANPLGVSAGLDKDADVPDALFALGPAVVEVGGCTPRPQPGNPRPRCFRVPALDGLVNRYGLNSCGAMPWRPACAPVPGPCWAATGQTRRAPGLAVPRGSLHQGRLLLVQIAENKATGNGVRVATDDYVQCVRRLAPFADVLVVNVRQPQHARAARPAGEGAADADPQCGGRGGEGPCCRRTETEPRAASHGQGVAGRGRGCAD